MAGMVPCSRKKHGSLRLDQVVSVRLKKARSRIKENPEKDFPGSEIGQQFGYP
jgi:hypothetical protein